MSIKPKFNTFLALFFALIFANNTVFAQGNDPEKIIERVKTEYSKVNDYRVDVEISIDVSFLKVPKTNAQIIYKKPDKIRILSEGFAMLPKEGLNFSPLSLFKESYTAFYVKEETVQNKKAVVVKVIPLSDKSEVILSTLWVDRSTYAILKVESTTRMNGTFEMNLSYNRSQTQYNLPSSMYFAFEVDKFNLPKGLSGPSAKKQEKKKDDGTKKTKGSVSVIYSNYKVNKGIADKEFEEKK